MYTALPFRQAAATMIFRQGTTELEFLLVQKPRREDVWQLPQGGMEAGESIEQAAARECQEEVQIKYTYLATSTTTYQYYFPQIASYERGDTYCGQQVHFCFGLVDVHCTPIVDDNEIVSFAWVTIDEVEQYITRATYKECIEKLYTEGSLLLRTV